MEVRKRPKADIRPHENRAHIGILNHRILVITLQSTI